MFDEKELVEVLTELRLTIDNLKKELEKLSGIEERVLDLEGRTVKMEQKILFIYTIVGGGIGALLSALVYKFIDGL